MPASAGAAPPVPARTQGWTRRRPRRPTSTPTTQHRPSPEPVPGSATVGGDGFDTLDHSGTSGGPLPVPPKPALPITVDLAAGTTPPRMRRRRRDGGHPGDRATPYATAGPVAAGASGSRRTGAGPSRRGCLSRPGREGTRARPTPPPAPHAIARPNALRRSSSPKQRPDERPAKPAEGRRTGPSRPARAGRRRPDDLRRSIPSPGATVRDAHGRSASSQARRSKPDDPARKSPGTARPDRKRAPVRPCPAAVPLGAQKGGESHQEAAHSPRADVKVMSRAAWTISRWMRPS